MRVKTRSGFGCAKAAIIGFGLLGSPPVMAEYEIPQIPSPTEAAERLRQCGFESVDVAFDDLLHEDVLTVPGVEAASDEQIDCAAHVSIETYYYLSLPDGLQERYWAAYWPLSEEKSREMSRDWLNERGLLENVPLYDPSVSSDTAYAEALESFCGAIAEGALASEYGPHAISPDWALKGMSVEFEKTGEAMMCLTSAAAVSGFQVYLIGNETERQPE